MNPYHAIIARTGAVPGTSGNPARYGPGILPVSPAERFSGIRSSGQYCCPQELTRTGPHVTACRGIRGQTAACGMCP
jgi:hypothetical protein